jgi:hypothetical protein
MLAYGWGWLTASGFLPALPVIVVSTLLYLAVHYIQGYSWDWLYIGRRGMWFGVAFLGVFLLAMDFWNWGKSNPLWLGLPYWLWYSVGLSLLQVAILLLMLRGDLAGKAAGPPALRQAGPLKN